MHALLTSPTVQYGLGITPGAGKWHRVKSISALHDEEADHAWIQKWTLGGDWQVGLVKGLEEKDGEALGNQVSGRFLLVTMCQDCLLTTRTATSPCSPIL